MIRFSGAIYIKTFAIDQDTRALLDGLYRTRRVKRNLVQLAASHNITVNAAQEKWGVDGEFYIDLASGNYPDSANPTISDYEKPPSKQPSLYCPWKLNTTNSLSLTDDTPKDVEWLEWLINNIFSPRGYTLDGTVLRFVEKRMHMRRILVTNNIVSVQIAVWPTEKAQTEKSSTFTVCLQLDDDNGTEFGPYSSLEESKAALKKLQEYLGEIQYMYRIRKIETVEDYIIQKGLQRASNNNALRARKTDPYERWQEYTPAEHKCDNNCEELCFECPTCGKEKYYGAPCKKCPEHDDNFYCCECLSSDHVHG